MPFVAGAREPTTDPVGELLSKFARPLPHRFVADDDTARGQQLLHHAEAKREAEIQPDGMADDLGGEPIPGVASATRCPHLTRLLAPICRRKRMPPQVDGAVKTAPRVLETCSLTGGRCEHFKKLDIMQSV